MALRALTVLLLLLASVLGAAEGDAVPPAEMPAAPATAAEPADATPTETTSADATPAVESAAQDPGAIRSPDGRAALIEINGMIDDQKGRYYVRALRQAVAAKVPLVVVHLTTDGGHLGAGVDILQAALNVRHEHGEDAPRMVAFIDNKAWSAGAMIAYGHQQVWLSPVAHIGDIGVIMIKPGGEIEYAPEKIETVVRAHLRSAGQANGWNTAKLQKMTALDQTLYRFETKDGTRWLIGDDVGNFLAANPEVKKEQLIEVFGENRLISYTASEAVGEGMATGLVRDLPELYQKLGVDQAKLVDLRPTGVEKISWFLSGFASLLASLTVLFIILELKSPGVGLWTICACCTGVAFFVCQYYQDLASHIELVIVLVGVLAVVVELFLLPTGGLLGFSGLTMIAGGLLLAFMPDELQFSFDATGFGSALASAFAQSLLALIMMTVGLALIIRMLPRLKAVDRIAVTAEIAATSAGTEEASGTLVGRRGTATTDLRPSGQVQVEGQPHSATLEEGGFLPSGSAVVVVAMRFGDCIVRRAETT